MLTENKKAAKECAIMDIQQELSRQGRCFVAFIERLNPVMDALVDKYEREQSFSGFGRSKTIKTR